MKTVKMFDVKAYHREYRQRPESMQKEVVRKRRFKINHPEKEGEYSLAYYYKNRDRILQQGRYLMREIVMLNKIKAFMHYSNPQGSVICNNCGEQDIDVLCLDHINNDGNQHRREIGTQGSGFYHWLIRNKYPAGFQVLCYNCNTKKSRIRTTVKTGTNN